MSRRRTRYFELCQGRSRKFWEITLDGREHTVRFGRIGSRGQRKTTRFGDADEARDAANRLMWRKHDKGYVHLGEEPPAAAGDYWGGVERDYGGYRSARAFPLPRFDRELRVALGPEDDGFIALEEPSGAELAELASVFQRFLDSIDEHHAAVQRRAFEQYRRVYARGAAQPAETVEDHARLLRLDDVRVQRGEAIRLIFDYAPDREHGLEVVLVGNAFWGVGGISDVLR
jgi:predicted DNA-binding WGR domain protein